MEKSKLKIGMILDKELPDMRVENEAEILGRSGFKVLLLALNYSASKSFYEDKKHYQIYNLAVKKWFVKKLRPFSGTILDLYSLIWRRLIRNFVKKEKINILHVHDLYMGLPAIDQSCPYLVDLHENYPATIFSYSWAGRFPLNFLLTQRGWKKQEKRILSRAKGIIALSKEFAAQLSGEYREENIENKFCIYPNVPNLSLIDSLDFSKNIFDGKGKYTIFYYGVIGQRRGIFECFESIKKLKDKIPQLHFLMVGPVDNADRQKFLGYLQDYKEYITHIKWVDFVEFPSLIKDVDICISPIKKNDQHESGVANKIFQYMYFEKPLIVSNCKPQQRIVEDYDCGYVYESGDVDDLSEVIVRAFGEQKRYGEMGARAKDAVENRFNTDTVSRELVKFYEKIMHIELL